MINIQPDWGMPTAPESARRSRRAVINIATLLILMLVQSSSGFALEEEKDCVSPALMGSEFWPHLQTKFAEQRKLLADNQLDKAIEVQRQIVRLQCHNHYQWYYLAELLFEAGEIEKAISWLDKLYDREVNDLETRLTTKGNPLFPLASLPDYLSSPLANKIAIRKSLFEQRQAQFHEQLALMPIENLPSAKYIAHDVCPFECCTYRQWGVREETSVFNEPLSHKVVGTTSVGEAVEGITGNVYLKPSAVAVVHTAPAYDPVRSVKKGDVVFLLDSIGEGFRHVWHDGGVISMSTYGEVQAMCAFPNAECWGEYLTVEQDHDWWVKVRLSNGTEGWTNNTHAFDNMDACG